MKNRVKHLFIFIIFSAVSSIVAQDDKKNITVIVSGSGNSLDDAKKAALISATEQAMGTFITSKTEMVKDQIIADEMVSLSNGNINSIINSK